MTKSLFDSTNLNGISLRNRFIRSATWEGMADEQGRVNKEVFDIYKELAEGELGLIITSGAYVLRDGKGLPNMFGLDDDSAISSFKELTDEVHHQGGKIVAQLVYCGTQSNFDAERVVYSPSAVPEKSTGRVGKEMLNEDFIQLKEGFSAAAKRAQLAGFDGVQIHAAHGYLLSQFLTPCHNTRSDKYGQSIENRSRLLLEVYDAVRSAVGKDFLVMAKVNCADFVDDGLVFKDSLLVCKKLAEQGIDALEISGGIMAAVEKNALRKGIHSSEEEAYFAEYTSMIAKEVNVPIIVVGGLRSLEVMEDLLQHSSIEYFSLARPLLAEPHLIKEWRQGRKEKARCLSCNKCITTKGNYCTAYRKEETNHQLNKKLKCGV